MSPKRVYLLMIIFTGLLGLAIPGSAFLGTKFLKQHADKLMEAKLQSRVLDEQQASLTKAKKAIDTYTELNLIASSVVPHDKDQAKTVRNITDIAKSLGIRLSEVSFPPSTLGQSTKASKSKETQVTPVPGLKGLYELQITIQSDNAAPITYDRFLELLEKLENNRRTAQVSSITILPNKDSGKLTFNLVLSTYIKP
jgi:hypothetical protein